MDYIGEIVTWFDRFLQGRSANRSYKVFWSLIRPEKCSWGFPLPYMEFLISISLTFRGFSPRDILLTQVLL